MSFCELFPDNVNCVDQLELIDPADPFAPLEIPERDPIAVDSDDVGPKDEPVTESKMEGEDWEEMEA